MIFNPKDIENYLYSLKELYSRIEKLDYEFHEAYENIFIELFKPFKVFNLIGEGIFPIIERITINKKVIKKNIRINDLTRLRYPPQEYVESYGRANLKFQSVLYGTFHFMTAIKEMNPDKGDLITISRWSLKNENESLVVCPMFLTQPTDGSSNYRTLEMYNQFIQELNKYPASISKLLYGIHEFYSACFAREIKSNQGYIFTAMLADKILNQYKNGIIDAILYPSTKENLRTENIAIKKDSYDKKYKLFQTVEKRLLDYSKNEEKYKFETLGESLRIDGHKIIWK